MKLEVNELAGVLCSSSSQSPAHFISQTFLNHSFYSRSPYSCNLVGAPPSFTSMFWRGRSSSRRRENLWWLSQLHTESSFPKFHPETSVSLLLATAVTWPLQTARGTKKYNFYYLHCYLKKIGVMLVRKKERETKNKYWAGTWQAGSSISCLHSHFPTVFLQHKSFQVISW